MKALVKLIKNYWPILTIILIELVLFFFNYTPHTYLIGWDNLFPELNFGLNFKRVIFAVWQEYRGLGLEDGLSHAANLPHYLFIYVLSWIFPQNVLRYVFVFSMHCIGGIGMYVLLRYVLKKIAPPHELLYIHVKTFAFIGAIFYQYNFAVVQMFYLPFEPFLVHFAFLPILIVTLLHYFEHPTRKSILFFGLFSFLATPQAHVPTVFLVYILILSIMLITQLIQNRKKAFKPILAIVLITFCTNAYWGLPFTISAIKNSSIIANSKNNQMATDDIFLKNHKYGDFKNTALMRGFDLDYIQYDWQTSQQVMMFAPWKDHLNNISIEFIGWTFFALTISGSFLILKEKRKIMYPFLLIFIFTFLIIGNDIPILNVFSYLLRTYVPLFHNVFRFVFTKFFIAYAFAYTILLVYGLQKISLFLSRLSNKLTLYASIGLILLFLALYNLPSFTGDFVYNRLRTNIPQEYFALFNYLDKESPNSRIAVLPAPWYWAWTQYKWGVINSGFQWFGLAQPTIDRAFDPWSDKNENFYWELSQSLYQSNGANFENLLDKYHIETLLVDKNIINAAYYRALYLDELEKILTKSDKVLKVRTFSSLELYTVKHDKNDVQNFVSLYQKPPNIYPLYQWNDFDNAYHEYGSYISDGNQKIDIYYPFRSLFTGRSQKELGFIVKESSSSYKITTILPKSINNYTLHIPQYDGISITNQKTDFPKISSNDTLIIQLNEKTASSPTDIKIQVSNETNLTIDVPKTHNAYHYDSSTTADLNQPPKSCDELNTGIYEHQQLEEKGEKILRLKSIDSSNCVNIFLPQLPQFQSYLVEIEARHIEGKNLLFTMVNKENRRTILDTYIEPTLLDVNGFFQDYIVIPPLEASGIGYNLSLDNNSIGRVPTINDIKRIKIYPIPYHFLSQMKLTDSSINFQKTLLSTNTISSTHPNPAEYWVTLNMDKLQDLTDPSTLFMVNAVEPLRTSNLQPTLVLSQSFNTGWVAYLLPSCELSVVRCKLANFLPFIFGEQLTNHVLVNNWANGWVLNSCKLWVVGCETGKADLYGVKKLTTHNLPPTTIYIFFWPQILEFVGFGLLPVPFLFLLCKTSSIIQCNPLTLFIRRSFSKILLK